MEKHFIDDLARKALDNMEVPYQPDDWALMEARLDQEKKLHGQLLFFKGVEVALVLLALWTIFQFLPAVNQGNSNTPESNNPALIIPAEKENAADQPAENNINNSGEELNSSDEALPLNQKNTKIQGGKPVANASENNHQKSVLKDRVEEDAATALRAPADPMPPDKRSGQPSETKIFNQNEIAYNNTLTLQDQNTTIDASTSDEAFTRSMLSIIMLPSRKPFQLEDDIKWAFFPVGGDPIPDKVKRPKRLSVIFSPDMNGMSNNLSMGFSFGGLVAKELNDFWDFESGLVYSYKPFDYLATDNDGNPIVEGAVQDVQLHIAEIPFMMQYSFNKSVNWRSYATFGASSFFVAHADYNKGNIELPVIVDNNSDKGLLQGGRFMSNFYLTANLGFGLERKLSKNTSLFVQPTFSYPLMKVGPYEDKLGTFSLAMGVRAML